MIYDNFILNHCGLILLFINFSGKAVGVVTTTRLTHATPATFYAHSPNRYWESDADQPENERKCKDLAKQLIYDANSLKVITM